MSKLEALLTIAVDLTASLATKDRYDRLLAAVRLAIACDATAVLRLEGNELVPVATHGLPADVMGRRFNRQEHPRLDAILRAGTPVNFPHDSPLPDPFDGLLGADPGALCHIHACLGCPLLEAGEVVGVLTADALQPGAFDGLEPKFLETLGALAGAAVRTTGLIEALEQAARRQRLVARDLLRDAVERSGSQILGISPAVERIRREIDMVARSEFSVLILGETGTGKELVARAIHAASPRSEAPLIYVNCAALPETIVESELFGHVRGAFTGAQEDRVGKFELAEGGALLLDEVGEMPLTIQPKLLRTLQDGDIQPVGSSRPRRVDVRVLAATNRDLEAEVEAGRFRLDLFHRLNVYPIHVPPLRDRRDDIPLLAGHFLDMHRQRLGLGPVRLAEEARRALNAAPWPGNVRELDHVLGRAVLRAGFRTERGKPVVIRGDDLRVDRGEEPGVAEQVHDGSGPFAGPSPRTMNEAVEEYKRNLIEQAQADNGGNWAAAARQLGMHRSNLHHMARRLGLIDGVRERRRPSEGSDSSPS